MTLSFVSNRGIADDFACREAQIDPISGAEATDIDDNIRTPRNLRDKFRSRVSKHIVQRR